MVEERRSRAESLQERTAKATESVAARLRHVAGTNWGSRRHLDMDRLREEVLAEAG